MTTDLEMIQLVQEAFGSEPRPEHFTNYRHCCECAEHDDLLLSRDPGNLKLEDVNNAGWDPICFVTEQGFRYYLPSLVRLALESAARLGWYLPQFLFHLIGDGPGNRRVSCCSTLQRQAVAAFLWHVAATRAELIAEYEIDEDLQMAIAIWSEDTANQGSR